MRDDSGYVLFMVVSMITALCILFFAVYNVYRVRYRHVIKYSNQIKARYLAEAGVEKIIYLLSKNGLQSLGGKYQELLGEKQSIMADISYNGGYLEIESNGQYIKEQKTVRAVLGEKIPESLDAAVQVNTKHKDIVVAGRNKIIGDVCLVDGKVFPSRVSGLQFKGGKAYTGEIIQKEKPNVLYDNGIKENIIAMKKRFADTDTYDEIIHSSLFFNKSKPFKRIHFVNKTVYVEGNLNIMDSCEIAGPCEFIVERDFIAEDNAKIQDCRIICGRKAKFRDHTKADNMFVFSRYGGEISGNSSFSGQFIAEDSITFNSNAESRYPSFFYCQPRIKDKKLHGGLFLKGNNVLEGVLAIGLRDTFKTAVSIPDKQRFLYISNNSEIHGIVFNNYATEYRGKIKGHITTSRFLSEIRKKTYGNWILNTVTDREQLSAKMILPIIFSTVPFISVLRLSE